MIIPKHPYAVGIFWMVAGVFANSFSLIINQYLVKQGISPIQLVTMSNGIAFCIFAPLMYKYAQRHVRAPRFYLLVLRSVLEVAGFYSAYTAFKLMPISTYTSLMNIRPLLNILMAAVILREKASIHSIIALLISLVGVFIITRPDEAPLDASLIWVAICLACFSTCGVIIRSFAGKVSSGTVTFYMLLLTCIFASIPASYVWQPVSFNHLPWIIGAAAFFAFCQFSIPRAFFNAPLGVILPFSYIGLVLASLTDIFLYNKEVAGGVYVGGAIILASSVYAAISSGLKKKVV